MCCAKAEVPGTVPCYWNPLDSYRSVIVRHNHCVGERSDTYDSVGSERGWGGLCALYYSVKRSVDLLYKICSPEELSDRSILDVIASK